MEITLYPGIPFSPQTILTNNIGAADSIIAVSDVSAFPPAPNLATIGTDEEGETILYTAKTGTALSGCQRGIEGIARAWAAGNLIGRNFTAKDHADLIGAIEGKQDKLTGAAGQVIGFDANGNPVAQGTQDLVGPQGPAGPAGADGAPGSTGPAGPQGEKGDTGLFYGTCSTAAATTAKAVTLSGFTTLTAGAVVVVKFTYANTAASPTLNVNGTGAKYIKKYGTTAPDSYMWQAGAVVEFVYDGSYWIMLGGTTATTTYYGLTKLSSSVSSTSTTEAATPSAVKQAYDLANQALTAANAAQGDATTALNALKKALGGTLPSPTLANNTPEVIQKVAAAGLGASFWSVGDKIGINLNGTVGALTLNSTYYAFIIGFNHNSGIEGLGIHFQFGKTSAGVDIAFVQSYGSTGTGFCMNTTNTNSGGWNNSYMRKTICPAFLSALPTVWQNIIVACTKYSDNTGDGSDTASYVTSTSDKIWLLSEFEVFGTRTGSNSAEQNYQKQYDYYKNGNSKVKYQHSATTTACYWWLRSVYVTNATYLCYVFTSGSASSSNAYNSFGFAPGFKVA